MCDFCSRAHDFPDRIFYESKKWFAFLAAPPHTKGHTILAAQPDCGKCPQDMNEDILQGFENALFEVTQANSVMIRSQKTFYLHPFVVMQDISTSTLYRCGLKTNSAGVSSPATRRLTSWSSWVP
jgi:hypothetical protein